MSVSERYAMALLKVGVEKGILEELEKDFSSFIESYKKEAELKKFFENPLIDNRDKKELISSVLGEKNKNLNNLLRILIDRNREKELAFIYESFMEKVRTEKNRVLCRATTAYELTEKEKNEIVKILEKQTQKEVELENVVDKSIVGGIIIKVGDRVYDYSVKGQLNSLRDKLLKTSLAKVG